MFNPSREYNIFQRWLKEKGHEVGREKDSFKAAAFAVLDTFGWEWVDQLRQSEYQSGSRAKVQIKAGLEVLVRLYQALDQLESDEVLQLVVRVVNIKLRQRKVR